jgi:putative peptidoglycan lipid II flippase
VLIPGNPDAWQLTRRLVWITFPYLIFIAAASALMAILNARDRFAAAAFTPVLLNLTMIASAAVMLRADAPILIWAVAAVVGGFLQWASLLPHAWRLGMRFWPRAGLADPALRRIGRLMLPGIVGVGITQINTLVGQLLASYLVLGSISSLFLAGRVTELPLGVFAISIATVVLPLMSRQAAAGNRSEMMDTLGFALRQTAFITLPATTGLLVLRLEIVSVLFERGEFGPVSATRTASALAGYSLGLIAFAAVRVVAPGFFALRDTRTPVLIAAVAMVANVVGCLALMPLLGHTGIAMAGSLAAFVNAALLVVGLRRKVGPIGGRRLAASFARLGGAAAVMAWVIWGVRERWLSSFVVGSPTRIAALAATVALGALTYLAAAAILRAPELGELRAWRSRVAP